MYKLAFLLNVLFIIPCQNSNNYDKNDFDFNQTDLAHLNSYKQGDTIYFENQLGKFDTILVKNIDKDQIRQAGTTKLVENRIWVSIEHLPRDKWHGIMENIKGKIEIDYQHIIGISKFPQTKITEYSFHFKDFYPTVGIRTMGEYHSEAITINKKRIENYYIIRHGNPRRITEPYNIEILYWTDKDGLTAYKNKNGDWWTKKSNR